MKIDVYRSPLGWRWQWRSETRSAGLIGMGAPHPTKTQAEADAAEMLAWFAARQAAHQGPSNAPPRGRYTGRRNRK